MMELVDEWLSGPLAPIADGVRAALAPSWRLVRCSGTRRTRIGGEPDLPPGTAWPEFAGRPLGFLAQVDASEVPPEQGMPTLAPGLWSFFYDVDPVKQPWGFDPADRGGARVLHVPPGAQTDRRPLRAELDPDSLYPPSALDFELELTAPDGDSPWASELGIDEVGELRDAYYDFWEALFDAQDHAFGDAPRHRLLGHPDQVQGEMQTECQLVTNGLYCGDGSGYSDPRAAALRRGVLDWRLLLQLDSEFVPDEVTWGDGGRVYFWLRENDLAAGRADAAWGILQCS